MWSIMTNYVPNVHGDIPPSLMVLFYSPESSEKLGYPASSELPVSQESLISIYSPESPGSPESQGSSDLPESSESQFHQFNQNRQFK